MEQCKALGLKVQVLGCCFSFMFFNACDKYTCMLSCPSTPTTPTPNTQPPTPNTHLRIPSTIIRLSCPSTPVAATSATASTSLSLNGSLHWRRRSRSSTTATSAVIAALNTSAYRATTCLSSRKAGHPSPRFESLRVYTQVHGQCTSHAQALSPKP